MLKFLFFRKSNLQSIFLFLLFSILVGANAIAKTSSEDNCHQHKNTQPISFIIDYKNTSSELCWLGSTYDTDKSSQRLNVTDSRHCHPYTLFYHSIFKDKRTENLVIAELGILHGASLLMWKDYFPNASLYGFEYNPALINAFRHTYNNDRISLAELNVCDKSGLLRTFNATGVQYDLIIEDTTHLIDDQIRVIESVHPFLKPGGMLIVEDIFHHYNEQEYIDRLQPILDQFQDYYFVSMNHVNKCSTGWDNDKIFVLVKAGDEPIFKNKKKMTIITPSIRPENLLKIKDSINFDYVDEWIIVYDGSKIRENPNLFIGEGNPKIKEYIHTSEGRSGNPQRNYALDHVQNEDTYLYFLDDDNLIHKDLYKLLDIIDDGKMYTFDQENRINGSEIQLERIDTAMFLIDFKLCKNTRWVLNEYSADFYYMHACYSKNKDKWVYVNNVLCSYNILNE